MLSLKVGKATLSVVVDNTSGSILAQAMITAGVVSECIAMERPKTKLQNIYNYIITIEKQSDSSYQYNGR